MSPEAKVASESAVEMTQIILPSHANSLGTIFGGQVAAWIDICAGVAAMRHARHVVVTASMDDLHFLAPAHVGEVLILKAHVNRAFRYLDGDRRARRVREPADRRAPPHRHRLSDLCGAGRRRQSHAGAGSGPGN